MGTVELHVQLAQKPTAPLPDISIVCQLNRKSKKLAKEFKQMFSRRDPDDWNPYTIAFICPHLMDAKLPRVFDFVQWLEDLASDCPDWILDGDSGHIRILNLNKRICDDVRNGLYGVSFSQLTQTHAPDRLIAPVIFMTYRRKDIRDL